MSGELLSAMAANAERVDAGTRLQPAEQVHWASYSSLAQHRRCPQEWNYARIRRLEAVESEDIAVERDFGSWWHMLRAADALNRGRKLGSLQWVPEKLTCVDNGPTLPGADATPSAVIQLATAWFSRLTPAVQEVWVERLGEGLDDRLLSLFKRWREQWGEQIVTERPLAVELKWTRRLPMPAGYEPVELIGYVDEIYQDTLKNMIVTRDHKVHRKLGTQSAVDDMMDSQLQIYSWGAAGIVKEWGLGPIQATGYDRARMTKPITPKVTAGGTLSKSVTDYDLHTYLVWSSGPEGKNLGVPWGEEGVHFVSGKRAGEPKFGRYRTEESEIARLSAPQAASIWFQRTMVPLNKNLIRTHLISGVESAMDASRTRARVEKTRMAGRNLGSACRWCDFSKLCRAEMFGGADGTYDLGDMGLREK